MLVFFLLNWLSLIHKNRLYRNLQTSPGAGTLGWGLEPGASWYTETWIVCFKVILYNFRGPRESNGGIYMFEIILKLHFAVRPQPQEG